MQPVETPGDPPFDWRPPSLAVAMITLLMNITVNSVVGEEGLPGGVSIFRSQLFNLCMVCTQELTAEQVVKIVLGFL